MRINHLKNFNIELTDIWSYEKYLFNEELKSKKKTKYTRECYEHFIDLYDKGISICVNYGKSHLTKKRSGDTYLEFQRIYRENNSFKERVTLGWFDFKGALYHLPQSIIIPKEEDSFDYWFALKLSQFDSTIKHIDNFLEYHLEKTFDDNLLEYSNFLTLMLRQYDDTVLTERILETVFEYIDFLSEEIDAEVSNQKEDKNSRATNLKREKLSYETYVLIGSKSDPDFFQKNTQKFVDIFYLLREQKLIHNDTQFTQFKALFSGASILPKNRIHWIAQNVDIKAFISILCDKYKIETPNSGIWKLTSKCFIDKNKQEFNPRRLGNSAPSEETKSKFRKIVTMFP